jgi:hypothetical protein
MVNVRRRSRTVANGVSALRPSTDHDVCRQVARGTACSARARYEVRLSSKIKPRAVGPAVNASPPLR